MQRLIASRIPLFTSNGGGIGLSNQLICSNTKISIPINSIQISTILYILYEGAIKFTIVPQNLHSSENI
jgi:hypothetical protein